MNTITFPLKRGMHGSKVADLQEALQVLLDRELIKFDNVAAQKIIRQFIRERDKQTFLDGTATLVAMFQKDQGLKASGVVDEPTANALNMLLEKLGVLDNVASGLKRLEGEVSQVLGWIDKLEPSQPSLHVSIQKYRDELDRYASILNKLASQGAPENAVAEIKKMLDSGLRELKKLAEPVEPPFRLVTGVLLREDGITVPGAQVRAAHVSKRGPIHPITLL